MNYREYRMVIKAKLAEYSLRGEILTVSEFARIAKVL